MSDRQDQTGGAVKERVKTEKKEPTLYKVVLLNDDYTTMEFVLRMPVMDGWTFRKEQRGDPGLAGIPIVVLSGVEADGVQDMDAAASFHKPVSFPEVVTVLRRLCEPSR